MPATKQCDRCAGVGTTAREARKLADGETPDPLDFRRRELCERCGGSGVIPENYAGASGKPAGLAVDQI